MPRTLTLEDRDSVEVWLVTEPPRSTMLIVHRDHPPLIRPKSPKPIRALLPGNVVVLQGEDRVVESLSPYR